MWYRQILGTRFSPSLVRPPPILSSLFPRPIIVYRDLLPANYLSDALRPAPEQDRTFFPKIDRVLTLASFTRINPRPLPLARFLHGLRSCSMGKNALQHT